MTGTRRALVVSAGIAICLWIASLDTRRPERRPDPPARQVEFLPIASRSDSSDATRVFQDAPEGKARPDQGLVRVRERVNARADRGPAQAVTLKTVELPIVRQIHRLALAPSSDASVAAVPVSDGSAEVYVPGCVGYAKRYWATGEDAPGAAESPGRRKNCLGGPPREIILEPMIGGLCANPERDRGLPSMCAQARRRR